MKIIVIDPQRPELNRRTFKVYQMTESRFVIKEKGNYINVEFPQAALVNEAKWAKKIKDEKVQSPGFKSNIFSYFLNANLIEQI